MTAPLRKLFLAIHLTSSVGWIGAVAAFLALAVAGVDRADEQLMRAAALTMELLASYVITPLAVASLLTGLIGSLGTQWGLFRHYWVLAKFLLTVAALGVLLVQLEPIAQLADVAAAPTLSLEAMGAAKRPLIHSAGGLVVLLVIQVLGVYKPRGLTGYGRRKQREAEAS